jgi:pyruvate-formate lyase-activating enzyme
VELATRNFTEHKRFRVEFRYTNLVGVVCAYFLQIHSKKENHMLNVDANDILQILDALKKSTDKGLVLYGIGRYACRLIALLEKHGVKPLCICDNNRLRWNTFFEGFEILSIEEAKSRFSDFIVFVSAEQSFYDILGYLVYDVGVNKNEIINYLPVAQRMGCRFLENHCIAADDKLSFCFSDSNESPSVMFNGDYSKTVDEFVALRKQVLHDIKNNIPNPCTNCRGLVTNYFPVEPIKSHLKMVTFQNGGVCNFKCSYCFSARNRNTTPLSKMDLPELFTEFNTKGLLAHNFSCSFVAGEITVNPRRESIFESLQMCDNCRIFTNALVYDENISNLISANKGRIVVSVDAGTRQTFKKIKGVDAFERVCETLRLYSYNSNMAIELKYILLPNVNDNEIDIDGFISLASEIKSNRITISSDMFNTHLIDENLVSMAEYLWKKAKDISIFCDVNSYALAEKMGIPTEALLLY